MKERVNYVLALMCLSVFWVFSSWRCGLGCDLYLAFPGPVVIELFSYSTQLSMKFILLINVKMPTFVGILTFISMIHHI